MIIKDDEIFLTFEEIKNSTKIDCTTICNTLDKFINLNGTLDFFDIRHDSDESKVLYSFLKSQYSSRSNYNSGEYFLIKGSTIINAYVEGLFKCYCYGSVENNEFLIAIVPNAYSKIKYNYYDPGIVYEGLGKIEHNKSGIFLPKKINEFYKTFTTIKREIASPLLKKEIIRETESKSEIDEICNKKNIWLDEAHLNRSIIHQFMFKDRDKYNQVFDEYYALSDIEAAFESLGQKFKINYIPKQTLSCEDKNTHQYIKELESKLKQSKDRSKYINTLESTIYGLYQSYQFCQIKPEFEGKYKFHHSNGNINYSGITEAVSQCIFNSTNPKVNEKSDKTINNIKSDINTRIEEIVNELIHYTK